MSELTMKTYPNDSNAIAVVLDEFGDAYIDTDETYDLIYEYHVKIKILKQSGVDRGDIIIPLRKDEKRKDKINWVKASSFNLEEGKTIETKLERKNVFIEDPVKFYELKKFSIPNVKVGTVIEYAYQLQTPFIFNFHSWEFQDDIPKIRSEYWAKYPANYNYNISLKGFYKLSKSEAELIEKCVVLSDNGYGQSTHADCTLQKFGMTNIPAFKEEEYMSAKSNYLSCIEFELTEVKHFNGKVDKVTKTWKDAEDELRNHKQFGLQIKRNREFAKESIDPILTTTTDSLTKAKSIFSFVQYWYQWNENNDFLCELGIEDSYKKRKGNVADINLSLVAALKYGGFNVDPLILSTRSNGFPKEIFPVLSDFNYVIARLRLNGKVFLLDATDDFIPFGLIPQRCLNGKGRVMSDIGSFWEELKPVEKMKKATIQQFVIAEDGSLKGSVKNIFYGYHAVAHRKNRAGYGNKEEYLNQVVNNQYPGAIVTELEEEGISEIDQPTSEKILLETPPSLSEGASTFYLSPFLSEEKLKNPFVSSVRLFPVDFGLPLEEITSINFELPPNVEVTELPDRVALALPNNGGRYQFEAQIVGTKLMVSSRFFLSKSIYSAEEYFFLKELYAKIIQVQGSAIVLSIKKP